MTFCISYVYFMYLYYLGVSSTVNVESFHMAIIWRVRTIDRTAGRLVRRTYQL